VLSRCQRFELHRLADAEIAARLAQVATAEGVTLEPGAALRLARMAQGALRDALTALEQCIAWADGPVTEAAVEAALGVVPLQELAQLAQAVERGDVAGCLTWVDRQMSAGRDPRLVAAAVRDLWYSWLRTVAGAGPAEVPPPAGWSVQRLARGLDRWIEAARQARVVEEPRLAVEVALAELVAPDPLPDLDDLARRVARLEAGDDRGGRPPLRTVTPPPSPPPASPPPGPDADSGRWSEILGRIRDRRANVAAYLAEAQPVRLSAEEVTLRFPRRYAFHFEQAGRTEHRRLVEEVLSQVFGGAPRLHLELEGTSDAG